MRGRWFALALAGGLVTTPASRSAAETRTIQDAAGRLVNVPVRIERVFAAGALATVLLYTLAPDRLVGWPRGLTPEEQSYLLPRFDGLPVVGKLSGAGPRPDLTLLGQIRPDLVLDYGSLSPAYRALADRVERETKLPYLMLDGQLSAIPRTYALLGDLLGTPDRARELARAAERILADVDARVAALPRGRPPRVYFARGSDGLDTEDIESLKRLGARNVAAGRGDGHLRATLDDIVAWDPDAIVTLDPDLGARVLTDAAWRRVRAVRDRRVHVAPHAPFAWLDVPPSVNRLIGLRWLGSVLYPAQFPEDLREPTRAFYALFLSPRAGRTTARRLDGIMSPLPSAPPPPGQGRPSLSKVAMRSRMVWTTASSPRIFLRLGRVDEDVFSVRVPACQGHWRSG
jgi:iron complex transport system substrate-binding protein